MGRKRRESAAECTRIAQPPATGWPPGMLQDDCKPLSQWLANRIDSRRHAREAVEAILAQACSPEPQLKEE